MSDDLLQYPGVQARVMVEHDPMSQIHDTFGARNNAERTLMHHYLKFAHRIYLTRHEGGWAIYWLESIQKIVCQSDRRMDLVLSLTCAHMASLTFDRRLLQASAHYQLRAAHALALTMDGLLCNSED